MLQNASLLAIVAVDTEENEPIKNEVWWVRRHFVGVGRRGAREGRSSRPNGRRARAERVQRARRPRGPGARARLFEPSSARRCGCGC